MAGISVERAWMLDLLENTQSVASWAALEIADTADLECFLPLHRSDERLLPDDNFNTLCCTQLTVLQR